MNLLAEGFLEAIEREVGKPNGCDHLTDLSLTGFGQSHSDILAPPASQRREPGAREVVAAWMMENARQLTRP
jgi:hypothetical protein